MRAVLEPEPDTAPLTERVGGTLTIDEFDGTLLRGRIHAWAKGIADELFEEWGLDPLYYDHVEIDVPFTAAVTECPGLMPGVPEEYEACVLRGP
jgi:hypothetical protein